MKPFQVVRDFEAALCEYTGAPYAVTTTSCTMALLLAVAWHLRLDRRAPAPSSVLAGIEASMFPPWLDPNQGADGRKTPIEIPKRTYVGVPMSIIHAGGRPTFRDEAWVGTYQLKSLPVWDSARWFTAGMYLPRGLHGSGFAPGVMLCVSFHWAKTLGIQQGGAILHDSPEADAWLRRARFDGREEGVAPKDDVFTVLGWHCMMTPEIAAAGLVRLSLLPRHNDPLPNSDYTDLSQCQLFKT